MAQLFPAAVKPPQHTCHAAGCPLPVHPRMWGCRRHWYMVSARVRDKIWEHYTPGQEVRKDPTATYLYWFHRAVIDVATREGKLDHPDAVRSLRAVEELHEQE